LNAVIALHRRSGRTVAADRTHREARNRTYCGVSARARGNSEDSGCYGPRQQSSGALPEPLPQNTCIQSATVL
jgi:hypothetical protein